MLPNARIVACGAPPHSTASSRASATPRAPDPAAAHASVSNTLAFAALMAAAGVAWGLYTLKGRSGGDPLANTTGNFVRSIAMCAVASILFLSEIKYSDRGILLAILSGSVASGIGYTIWYAALKHLTSTRAAVLQLAVPVIAAAGGIMLLGEAATARFGIAAALILGGIAMSIVGRKR